MKITKTILVLASALLLFYPVSSKADTFDFQLATHNAALNPYLAPYADVHIDLTGTTATITFTSDVVGGNIYLMGDGGKGNSSVSLNVSGSFSVISYTGTVPAGFNGPQLSNTSPSNMDGFGSFNLALTEKDGYSWALNSVTIVLTGTWDHASEVLTDNTEGYMAAAHIFVTTSPADKSNTALATGFAADGPPVTVPEPGILILLGIAMSAIGAASWKISKL